MLDELFAGMTAAGSLLTAGAVAIGVRQLRVAEREADLLKQEIELVRDQAQTAFEDDLSREYRGLIGQLPVEAFYASPGRIREGGGAAFYRYFDLSNEQLFLARLGRVSAATSEQWKDGIEGNLRLPAFQTAWAELVPHLAPGFFEDLQDLRHDRGIPGPSAPTRQGGETRTVAAARTR